MEFIKNDNQKVDKADDISTPASATQDTGKEQTAEVLKKIMIIKVTMLISMFLVSLICSLTAIIKSILNPVFGSITSFTYIKHNFSVNLVYMHITWPFLIYKSTKRKIVIYLIIFTIFYDNDIYFKNNSYKREHTYTLQQ